MHQASLHLDGLGSAAAQRQFHSGSEALAKLGREYCMRADAAPELRFRVAPEGLPGLAEALARGARLERRRRSLAGNGASGGSTGRPAN